MPAPTTSCPTAELLVACGVLLPVQLRRLVQSMDAEDTGTCVGFSRLSLLSKLAYLMGWDIHAGKEGRFLFYSAGSEEAQGEQGEQGMLLSSSANSDNNSDIIDNGERSGNECNDADSITSACACACASASENANARTRTLVVAFSGGAVNKIGISRTEFRRTIQGLPGAAVCDQLYVHDPSGMSFYGLGDASFVGTLRGAVRAYDRVVFVGNCMGASAVLRFAHLLPTARSTALAVNPEVEPWRDWRRPAFLLTAVLLPGMCFGLRAEILRSVCRACARVHVHASSWGAEQAQAELLLGSIGGASPGLFSAVEVGAASDAMRVLKPSGSSSSSSSERCCSVTHMHATASCRTCCDRGGGWRRCWRRRCAAPRPQTPALRCRHRPDFRT